MSSSGRRQWEDEQQRDVGCRIDILWSFNVLIFAGYVWMTGESYDQWDAMFLHGACRGVSLINHIACTLTRPWQVHSFFFFSFFHHTRIQPI